MAIQFLLDETQKKEEALVNDILQVIQTKPDRDAATKKLATFIDAVFRTAAERPKAVPAKLNLKPQLLQQAPIELEKEEYLIRLFNTPVGILLDKKSGKYTYHVMEPHEDAELIHEIKESIRQDLSKDHHLLDDKDYLQEQTTKICKKTNATCDADTTRRATYYLKRDLLGFRRLDPLMHDMNVIAIYCDGTNKPVKIDYKGLPEKIETNVMFTDPKDLNVLINRIARFVNAPLTASSPVIDTTVNGFRIQATAGISGISAKLTIKKSDNP